MIVESSYLHKDRLVTALVVLTRVGDEDAVWMTLC